MLRRVGVAPLLSIVVCISINASTAIADCTLPIESYHTVVRVLNGETLVLDDGREVRLVGALAPHALDAVASSDRWPPAEAAREALSKLVLGKDIGIAAQHKQHDRNNRLGGQVFIKTGNESRWAQGAMLRQGMARAYSLDSKQDCTEQMLAAEAPARRAKVGLWGQAAYAVRGAHDAFVLKRLRGTFQVVEGRVLSVNIRRSRAYLNFAARWRLGFSVVVPVSAAVALKGRVVRVRGWITGRLGPQIKIVSPEFLEVLTEAPRKRQPRSLAARTIEVNGGE